MKARIEWGRGEGCKLFGVWQPPYGGSYWISGIDIARVIDLGSEMRNPLVMLVRPGEISMCGSAGINTRLRLVVVRRGGAFKDRRIPIPVVE